MVLTADPLRTVSEWEPGPKPRGEWGLWGDVEDLGLPGLTTSYDIWILWILLIYYLVSWGHGMLFYGVAWLPLSIGLDLDAVSNPILRCTSYVVG